MIYPGGEQAALAGSTKIIDADGITDRDYLYRQLVGAYIAGHDVIELRSEGELSSMVASTASSFTQTAIGLEILEESESFIVIKDLMDQGEIKPAKSVERMKVLVRNMLNDVLDALEEKNPKIIEAMSERDREVDRLDWLISRQVSIHQKDITISRRMGMDLCEITRCGSVSRSVERIGDHAVLLASNLRPIIEAKPTEVDDRILSTGRDVVTLFTDSVGTWTAKNMDAANKWVEGDRQPRRCHGREDGNGRRTHLQQRQKGRRVLHGHRRDRHQLRDGLITGTPAPTSFRSARLFLSSPARRHLRVRPSPDTRTQ